MSYLSLNIPESVKLTLAHDDLQHVLLNVERIEKLKKMLTLIDKAIKKYTLHGEKIAVYECETLKIYVLRDLEICERSGLIFPNRIDERYGFRPTGHVGYLNSTENDLGNSACGQGHIPNNELDETMNENENKIEKLNESIERMESKITELEQISYKLEHR